MANGLSFEPKPDTTNPLGVVFPGTVFNETGLPNWVGHLITKYRPGPLYTPPTPKATKEKKTWLNKLVKSHQSGDGKTADEQDPAWTESPLLVYDYARGGDTMAGVRRQVQTLFLPNVGTRPEWAPWNSKDTLFGMYYCQWLCILEAP